MKFLLLLLYCLHLNYAFKVINKSFKLMADFKTNVVNINETVYYQVSTKDLVRDQFFVVSEVFPCGLNNFTNFTVKIVDPDKNLHLSGFSPIKLHSVSHNTSYKALNIEIAIDKTLLKSLKLKKIDLNFELLFTYSGSNIFGNTLNSPNYNSALNSFNLEVSGENLEKDLETEFEILILNAAGYLKENNKDLKKMEEFGFYDKKGYKLLKIKDRVLPPIIPNLNDPHRMYKIKLLQKITKKFSNLIQLQLSVNENENRYENKVLVNFIKPKDNKKSEIHSDNNKLLRKQEESEKLNTNFMFLNKIKEKLEKIEKDTYDNFIVIIILTCLLIFSFLMWSDCFSKSKSSYKLALKF